MVEKQPKQHLIWRWYLAIVPLLVIPFVILTGLSSFAVMHFIFGTPLFGALIYGLVAFFAACALVFGSSLFYKKAKNDSFLRQIIGKTREERKAISEAELAKISAENARSQTQKVRKNFYTTMLIVSVYMAVFAWFVNSTLGLYPAEVFMVPFPVLAALWIVLVLFLPRGLIIATLIVLSGLGTAVTVLGPVIILQLIPYIIMFPLLMFMNFFMMFGPLMIFNIMQIKIIRPGEAKWNVSLDDVRGQEEAKSQILTSINMLISEEGERLIELGGKGDKGILIVGGPGTGKTLIATAVANYLNAPLILTTGSAFMATFIGIDIAAMMYMLFRGKGLAKEYGGKIVYVIDEAELLLQRRAGMAGGDAGSSGSRSSIWSLFNYDEFGSISSCGLTFDTPEAREIFWQKKFPQVHPQMFPFMGGGQGGSMAIFPYLVALDGVGSPPLMSRLVRGKVNQLLDVLLFVPRSVKWQGKTVSLRLSPGKPEIIKDLHIALTNRPQMIDPAMRRPGRFGRTVTFNTPGEEEREDIADLYFGQVTHDPQLDAPSKRKEFARATVGLSPAEVERVQRDAITFRHSKIEKMRQIKKILSEGRSIDEKTKKYWEHHLPDFEGPDGEKLWATWDSLMEALGSLRYGMAKPTRTTQRHQETTAYHEFAGHFLPLKYFCGEWMRPTVISVMPRGEALGMVAHVPIEEFDPQPQRILDGMIRVSVGSTVAERIYFGDSQPGVSSDLENATRIASAMVGAFGMVPRKCSAEEWKRYAKIGGTVLSVAGAHGQHGEPTAVGAALSAKEKRESVCVMLGQAFVDSYRLIVKNKGLANPVVEQLLEHDEIVGEALEKLWDNLTIKPLDESDKSVWPTIEVEPENPFYQQA